jgi:hypothetical protein
MTETASKFLYLASELKGSTGESYNFKEKSFIRSRNPGFVRGLALFRVQNFLLAYSLGSWDKKKVLGIRN